jgi:hypothetical protein
MPSFFFLGMTDAMTDAFFFFFLGMTDAMTIAFLTALYKREYQSKAD